MDIRFEEFTYLSSDGQTPIHAYLYEPQGIPLKGIVQLSHGMCEYVTRYDAVARFFAENGFLFCGNDHLGHGKTAPDEDELGYMGENGFNNVIEDLHTMSVIIRTRYPHLPLILYGHSMGSFIARGYLSRYGKELTAALLSGTAGPGQPAGLAIRIARTIKKHKGDHYRSPLLTSLAFGSYNRRFKREGDGNSWLTREKAVREAYGKDPFCQFVFTTTGYETLFTLLRFVSAKDWPRSVPSTLPIFLFSGAEDPVGAYGKGIRKLYRRMTAAGLSAVTLKLYENGRHEMHNETNREEVLADMLTFINGILDEETEKE